MDSSNQNDYHGQIKDLVSQALPHNDPFLYYLPNLLAMPEFSLLHSKKLVEFVQQAVLYEKKPIIEDALRILNKLVDPNDGRLLTPTPAHYYQNYSFSWSELGNKKDVVSVINHVLNKSLFQLSLGS
jgi:hypothetical protein